MTMTKTPTKTKTMTEINTCREHLQRVILILVTFETFDQSDVETSPAREYKDKYKYKDKDNDKKRDIKRTPSNSNLRDL